MAGIPTAPEPPGRPGQPAPIREPAVAGSFYPDEPAALRADVTRFLLDAGPGSPAAAEHAGEVLALMAPHAGYVYSGAVAGAVYAAADLPEALIILCPNHTGAGSPIAVMNRGGWRTPLGTVPIHERLADRILGECLLAQVDDRAHAREHALEVQIPFLQVKLGTFAFVPICVGTQRLPTLAQLGHDLWRAVAGLGEPAAVIISSDMSHYIPAADARAKDMLAIERMLALDPEGLHRVVHERDISMCGVAPAVAGLTCAIDAGASGARLVAYANSGDTSGDFGSVVGYAGLVVA